MQGGLLSVKFVNIKNCFLHFSHGNFTVYGASLVCGLKVVTSKGRVLYFTPSASPSSDLNENTVGLSAVYAKCLKLSEGETLRVKALSNLGSVNRIFVNPATQDDYDLIHSMSSAIESSLLSQLRIVWPGQVFCCWITKNVSVCMVVGEIHPNLSHGRLEEYTEIVVGDSIVGDKREAVGKSTPFEDVLRDADPVAREIQCRALLLDDNLKRSCKLDRCVPPFVVYMNAADKPSWYVGSETPLWKLTPSPGSAEESTTTGVVVQVIFIDEQGFDDRPWVGFVSLAVTESVRHFLKIRPINGAKVLLKPLPKTSLYVNRKRSSGLLITPSFKYKNPELLVKEIREELFNMALFSGGILLNTKSRLYLSSPFEYITLTLRPLDLDWTCLLLTDLQDFSISVNEYAQVDDTKNAPEPKLAVDCNDVIDDEDRRQLLGALCRSVETGSTCDNVLICGKNGSGKTTLASHLLYEMSNAPYFCYTHQINCFTLKGKRIEVQTKIFLEILNDCIKYQPSILLLDNIDVLGKHVDKEKEETEASLYYNRVSHKLLALFEEFQNKHTITLIGTASSPSAVNGRLYSRRGRSLFTRCFEIADLTQVSRSNILKELLVKHSPHLNVTNESIDNAGKTTEGFLPIDLVNVARRAYFEACKRKDWNASAATIEDSDLTIALIETRPSYLSGMNLLKEKTYSWSNVGGLHEAKRKLTEMILWPSKYPHIMNQCPLKPQMGVLLYGAPGSGKTILARASARESGLNFIVVKGPELMSKYIGQSEEAVRNIFNKASSAKPSILFFDEFESLAPRRGQDQTGVTDRVVNQFLTALDGVEPLTGVFVIAATSRPDLIDPALLRPGRIGTLIHCPFPNEAERFEILCALSSEISLDGDVDFMELAKLTEGYSGADLKGVLTSAQMMLIDTLVGNVDIDINEITNQGQKSDVTLTVKRDQLLEALRSSKPTLSETERQRYESIYSGFLNPSLSRLTQQKVTLA